MEGVYQNMSADMRLQALIAKDTRLEALLKELGEKKAELNQCMGVTSAVFARGILEDFLKRFLGPYISMRTADGIEAAYLQFLRDSNNADAVRMNAMISNRMSHNEFAKNCKIAYSKLSKVVHAAATAYKNLHANEMFVNVLLQIPRLNDDEKYSVEILSEFL